jgi:hypothetical protein
MLDDQGEGGQESYRRDRRRRTAVRWRNRLLQDCAVVGVMKVVWPWSKDSGVSGMENRKIGRPRVNRDQMKRVQDEEVSWSTCKVVRRNICDCPIALSWRR